MIRVYSLAVVCLAAFCLSLSPGAHAAPGVAPYSLSGEHKLWHCTTLTFDGPETSEEADSNPFRDYRLQVTFTHEASGDVAEVPGFYAADGNAAESS